MWLVAAVPPLESCFITPSLSTHIFAESDFPSLKVVEVCVWPGEDGLLAEVSLELPGLGTFLLPAATGTPTGHTHQLIIAFKKTSKFPQNVVLDWPQTMVKTVSATMVWPRHSQPSTLSMNCLKEVSSTITISQRYSFIPPWSTRSIAQYFLQIYELQ